MFLFISGLALKLKQRKSPTTRRARDLRRGVCGLGVGVGVCGLGVGVGAQVVGAIFRILALQHLHMSC